MASCYSVSIVSSQAVSLFFYIFLFLVPYHASTVGAQTRPEANSRVPFVQIGSRLFVQGGPFDTRDGPFFSLDLAASWPLDAPAWTAHNYGKFGDQRMFYGVGVNQTLYMFNEYLTNTAYRVSITDTSAKWSPIHVRTPDGCLSTSGLTISPRTGVFYNFPDNGGIMCLLSSFERGWEGRLVTNGTLLEESNFDGITYNSNRNSIMGGFKLKETTSVAYITEYRIDSNSWSTFSVKGQMPTTREGNCMTINEDSTKIVVFGGLTPASSGPIGFNIPSSEIFVLNLNSGEWRKGPNAAEPRASAACGLAGDRFVAWGGEKDPTSDPYDSIVVFDLTKFEWLKASSDDHPSSTPSSGPTSSGVPTTKASNTNIGAIAGGAVAGLVLVALIVAVLIYRRRKQTSGEEHGLIEPKKVKQMDNPKRSSEDEPQHKNELTYRNPHTILSPRSPQQYPYLGRDPQWTPNLAHDHAQGHADRIVEA